MLLFNWGVTAMETDYKELYLFLFNKITDAIEELDSGRVDQARACLIEAQCEAEERYISASL